MVKLTHKKVCQKGKHYDGHCYQIAYTGTAKLDMYTHELNLN